VKLCEELLRNIYLTVQHTKTMLVSTVPEESGEKRNKIARQATKRQAVLFLQNSIMQNHDGRLDPGPVK